MGIDPHKPGRYYVIRDPDGYPGPYVVAECVDWSWADVNLPNWQSMVALSRLEAFTDPRYRAAVEAWEARDDSTYATSKRREAADVKEWADRGGFAHLIEQAATREAEERERVRSGLRVIRGDEN